MTIKSIQKLYFFSFILLFFPMFFVLIYGASGNFAVSLPFLCLTYILCLISKPKKLLVLLKKILKCSVVKILLIFMIVLTATTLFHIFIGEYTVGTIYYFVRIYKIYIAVTLIYLFPCLALFLKIPLKKIIQLFYICLWIICLFGFFQYFGYLTNSLVIDYIMDFLTNGRSAWYPSDMATAYEQNHRMFSLFNEPGVLGKFIFMILPFVFQTYLSKYKIFQNKWLNMCTKKLLLPLYLIMVILTKSPIWTIFSFIEIAILILFNLKRKIRNIIIVSILTFSYFFYMLYSMNIDFQNAINDSFFNRVVIVFDTITNLDKFVEAEPSLASRCVSIYMNIKIFLANFIWGVGYKNIGVYANSIFLNLNIPVTRELIFSYNNTPLQMDIGTSIIFTTFAELGIIGGLLYILFAIFNIISLFKIKIYTGMENTFRLGLAKTLVAYFILSFYTTFFDHNMLWLLYGLSLLLIFNSRYLISERKVIAHEQNSNIRCDAELQQ